MLEEDRKNKKKIVSSIDRLKRQHHLLYKELVNSWVPIKENFGRECPF
jgi:hypothetical protein